MKNRGFVAVALALIVIALASCPNDSPSYSVGDTGPSGGLIFYDKGSYSDGWRYLEAAPSDIGSPTQYLWGGDVVIGATDASIGSGANNTAIIIAALGDYVWPYAAEMCDTLVSGGYSDWFLPSKTELQLMYTNLYLYALGGFDTGSYWSSTETTSDNYAYLLKFYNNESEGDIKSRNCFVRAARRF